MDQLSDFVVNNWVLVTLFVTVAMALLVSILRSFEGVTPLQAVNLINKNSAVVFDVRSEADFQKGHIIGALSFPSKRLSETSSDLKKYKDETILVCCQSGGVSISAVKTLKDLGFEQAQIIKGGIFAWQQENFPLVKGK